jgi:endo-1,3(4)-beta-glucanase
MTLDEPTASSIKLNLLVDPGVPNNQKLTLPLVQGTGFVTGLYYNLTPVFQSGVFFKTVSRLSTCAPGVTKYRITLEDNRVWILYAIRTTSNSFTDPAAGAPLELSLVNNHRLQSSGPFTGIIQIAKSPSASAETLYDRTAGSFCTEMRVSASVEGAAAKYSFHYQKSGVPTGNGLLMWALPHNIASMISGGVNTGVTIRSQTKGLMTAVVMDEWEMIERELPTDIGFFPWKPGCAAPNMYSPEAINVIANAVAVEVAQDMEAQTNLNSMYFSGKVHIPSPAPYPNLAL